MIRPQPRDPPSIGAASLRGRYRVRYAEPACDPQAPFDAIGYLDRIADLPVDGVVATHDNAALLAALAARRLGLPGPTPEAVFACQYKPISRARQRAAVPTAVPRFATLGAATPFDPPFFLKPVISTLSIGARRIDDLRQLALPEPDPHARRYAPIAALMGLTRAEVCGFLMEELMTGDEVTLEGYVHDGGFTAIGITDSRKYAGTDSFERFEYPTALPDERQAELVDVAARVVAELQFDGGMLNLEFFVPARGPVRITEVNARLAAQYAPLIAALHGRSTYEVLFALACGEDPSWRSERPCGVAISYCVRAFADALVERVPEPDPEHGLEVLVQPGRRLSEQGQNDPASYRLAIFYETGETQAETLARCRERAAALDFVLS